MSETTEQVTNNQNATVDQAPDDAKTPPSETEDTMRMKEPVAESTPPALESKLTEAETKATEYLNGWQRTQADFANYRKRAEKERSEAHQNGAVETLVKLLPVLDDFERAVANIPADRANDEILKGFSLIQRKLVALLENAGIKVLDPLNQPFDPAFHEGIGFDQGSTVESGHVSTVLQKGYVYGDRVLRPALVRVAS